MAREQDQARPLAGSTVRPVTDGESPPDLQKKNPHRRKLLKCCFCVTSLILIPIIILLTLVFTLFRARDPIITLNRVTLTRPDQFIPEPGSNMSMIVDVSVKNPNRASFRYGNTTTWIYYRGAVVGEARGPPGKARARGTSRMNVTVEIMTDRLMSRWGDDVAAGELRMGSYTRVKGRVKVLGIVRRSVTVKMNCTMSVSVASREMRDQECKQKVDF